MTEDRFKELQEDIFINYFLGKITYDEWIKAATEYFNYGIEQEIKCEGDRHGIYSTESK